MIDTDVLISGGGIAGLSLAAALEHAGARVTVVDPGRAGVDLRSTAYLLPARALFEEVGLWQALAPHTTALQALRVMDTRGWPPEITETRTFTPDEMGAAEFGWNIPNEVARAVLVAHLQTRPGITLRLDVGFQSMLTRTSEARVRLSDGSRVRARLVVAADGRASAVREAAGIGVVTARNGQKALAFHARHEVPHGNVSTEIYNQGGAFTTVPLPDHEGQPSSAIVWMNDGPRAQALAAMDPDAFNAEMTARACSVLGPMQALGAPNVWPVVTQRATELVSERVAILAEAAHVLPPIGAQGLNTSLNDVRALYDLVAADLDALGSEAQLAAYARKRATDTKLRAQAIDAFNRVCKSGSPLIQAARSQGLRAAYDVAPLRRGLMRAGLGN
jgi:2-octaprenyl-6-methoxyphenol hydroxylase